MNFNLIIDLSEYLKNLSKKRLSASEQLHKGRDLIITLEIEFCKKLMALDLPKVVKQSCAVVNLGYHYGELVKNSIDSFIKKYLETASEQRPLLVIEININHDEARVMVNYQDNGKGFDQLKAGACINYEESKYSNKFGSSKGQDKTQFGGAGKGLKLLAKNLKMVEASLLLSNPEKGGASLTISSTLSPYALPSSHNTYNGCDADDGLLQLKLPSFCTEKKEAKATKKRNMSHIGMFPPFKESENLNTPKERARTKSLV